VEHDAVVEAFAGQRLDVRDVLGARSVRSLMVKLQPLLVSTVITSRQAPGRGTGSGCHRPILLSMEISGC
jgi:hypothetical protein